MADGADGIALDAAGNVYVTGITDVADFPTAGPPSQGTKAAGWDAFVAKVSETTGPRLFHLPRRSVERAWGIAVDDGGNACVTGQTASTDFPTTGGPLQPTCGGAFISRLGPSSELLYSTCIGDGVGPDVAVDRGGDAYVTGSAGPDFPVGGTPSQPTYAGGWDAFVAKLRMASLFYTTTPCRVVDTRNAPGPRGGPALGANSTRSFPLTGGPCAIPLTASAVAANLTVATPEGSGHLRVYPAGRTLPTSSALNFVAGQTRANNAVMPLGAGGQITVYCAMPGATANAHFVLDVVGFFQ